MTLSFILLTLTFTIEFIVAYKVRLRLDWSMIVISLAFLLSFSIRSIVLPFNQAASRMIQATASLIIQAMLYFFVFEMVNMQLFLQSESKEQLQAGLLKMKRITITVYILFATLVLIPTYLVDVVNLD